MENPNLERLAKKLNAKNGCFGHMASRSETSGCSTLQNKGLIFSFAARNKLDNKQIFKTERKTYYARII